MCPSIWLCGWPSEAGRVKKVLKVATAQKTDSLGTIKEILGYEFEYWEIKMALAVGKRAREVEKKEVDG